MSCIDEKTEKRWDKHTDTRTGVIVNLGEVVDNANDCLGNILPPVLLDIINGYQGLSDMKKMIEKLVSLGKGEYMFTIFQDFFSILRSLNLKYKTNVTSGGPAYFSYIIPDIKYVYEFHNLFLYGKTGSADFGCEVCVKVKEKQ